MLRNGGIILGCSLVGRACSTCRGVEGGIGLLVFLLFLHCHELFPPSSIFLFPPLLSPLSLCSPPVLCLYFVSLLSCSVPLVCLSSPVLHPCLFAILLFCTFTLSLCSPPVLHLYSVTLLSSSSAPLLCLCSPPVLHLYSCLFAHILFCAFTLCFPPVCTFTLSLCSPVLCLHSLFAFLLFCTFTLSLLFHSLGDDTELHTREEVLLSKKEQMETSYLFLLHGREREGSREWGLLR